VVVEDGGYRAPRTRAHRLGQHRGHGDRLQGRCGP
jgi:hypothetical protein